MLFRFKNHLSKEGTKTALAELPALTQQLPSVAPERLKQMLNTDDFSWCVITAFEGGSPNRRVTGANPAALMHGLVLDFDFDGMPALIAKPTAEIAALFAKRHSKHVGLRPSALSRTSGGGVRAYYQFATAVPADVDKAVLDRFILSLVRKLVGSGERCVLPGLDLPLVTRTNQLYDAGRGFHLNPDAVVGEGVIMELLHAALTKPERSREEISVPLEVLRAWHQEVFPDAGIDWSRMSTDGWRPGKRYWDGGADSDSVVLYKDGAVCFTGAKRFVRWRDMFPDGRVDRYGADLIAAATRDLYFAGSGKFYAPDAMSTTRWIGVTEPSVKRRLLAAGLSAEGGGASEVSRALGVIESNNTVSGCFPFVFEPEPVVRFQGGRYLNVGTASALRPAESAGDWGVGFPKLATFFDGFWKGDEERQQANFLAWWKRFYGAALDGKSVRGQAVFLAGAKSSGKNFGTEGVLSHMVGGHSNGEEFLTGRDAFSANVFSKGLVLLNDPDPPTTRASKQKFTAMLKKHVANETVTYRAMYSNPVTLPWQGRFIVTINDNPAALESLPEISADLIDKLMFFRVQAIDAWSGRYYPSDEEIVAELPAFAAWLLAWEPPSHLVTFAARFGMEAYHHPSIMAEASSLTAHSQIVGYVYDYLTTTGAYGESRQNLSELYEQIAENARSFTSQCRTRSALDRALREVSTDETYSWVKDRTIPGNRVHWTFDIPNN